MSNNPSATTVKKQPRAPKKIKNPKAPPTRKLPLVKMFCDHASNLVAAAESGADAHGTGNIAESGGPFEKRFLKLFADALSPSVRATSGYFMDKDWTLSKQADFMLCDNSEWLHLPPSPDLAQNYVPLTSLHVFGQLKNSATKALISYALKQVSENLAQAKTMSVLHAEDRLHAEVRGPALSVVVFARGGNPSHVDAALQAMTGPKPTYILLIEKGIIFAGPHPHINESYLPFDAYRHNGKLTQCRVAGKSSEASGRALLWIFFAILWKINLDHGNNKALGPLVDKVARD